MKKREFVYLSSNGEQQIHAIVWEPDGAPKALFQISHGVAEYIGRYEPFAEFLTSQGFLVFGNDHLGHGLSRPSAEGALYFGDDTTWFNVADDLYLLSQIMKLQYPDLPLILLGHSMGSFLARTYLIRNPGVVDAAIVMGTGQNPPSLISSGKFLAKFIRFFIGRSRASVLVNAIAFGPYNKPFRPNRTAYDWLSVSEENVNKYIKDPNCGAPASVQLFYEMLCGMEFNADPDQLRKMSKSTPILFISGAEDPVGQMSEGVKETNQTFLDAGVKDTAVILYPGYRHEILNDECKDKVYQDIMEWITSRLSI